MKENTPVFILMCVAFLSACNDNIAKNQIKSSLSELAKSVENNTGANPLQYYSDALQKAKDVEGILQDATDQRLQAIDSALE